jgi:hypothetical protein
LGTSLHLYDLAVDPQMDGDKTKLANFLIDIVYGELCENKTGKACKDNLLRYLKVLDIENFQNSPDFVKNILEEKLISRLVQTKVTSVLIDKELKEENMDEVKALRLP